LIHSTLSIVVVSYLLGSIPFGYLLVRIFRGQDVRQTGSGNIGATNVARTGSKGLAVATLLLDALKGYVAVVHVFFFAPHHGDHLPNSDPTLVYTLAALAGLCAILGHMFPVWLRFKGGKGVATAVGAYLGIAPTAVLVVLVLFVAIVSITRYVSLGSMAGAAIFPIAAWWLNPFTRTASVMLLIAASSLLIIIRHKDNIRRLLAGDENRFGNREKGSS
jgi:acyl phosphate:glycerol-3-phosphate acyltransferase